MYDDSIRKFAEAGTKKALLVKSQFAAFFIGAAMAGAYIGFGDVLMFTVGAHLDPAWSHLVMGIVFSAIRISVWKRAFERHVHVELRSELSHPAW